MKLNNNLIKMYFKCCKLCPDYVIVSAVHFKSQYAGNNNTVFTNFNRKVLWGGVFGGVWGYLKVENFCLKYFGGCLGGVPAITRML